MSRLIRDKLTGLTVNLIDLKQRVRHAVTNEVSRAVSDAIHEVVQGLLDDRGSTRQLLRIEPPPHDHKQQWHPELDEYEEPPMNLVSLPGQVAAVSAGTAIGAGVAVARWWLTRNGSRHMATGLGLGVGLLAIVGGPTVRAALTVLATVSETLGTPDSLLEIAHQSDD